MDKSTVLAIIGTTATIILGAWSIYLALKRRYAGRIALIEEDNIGLSDSIVRNLPELSVLYKNNPVDQSLVLFKGILHNTGSIDITESMVEENLAIILPEGYKWLTARIVSSSPKVRASVDIQNETSLVFDMGLFRCDEHIRFEALAEVPMALDSHEDRTKSLNQKLHESISVDHRIASTKKVKLEKLSDYRSPIRKRRLLIMGGGMVIYTVFISTLVYFSSSAGLHYLLHDGDRVIEVTANPKIDGNMEVKGVNEQYKQYIPAKDFFSTYQLEPKIVSTFQELRFILVIMWIALGGVVLCIAGIIYLDTSQKKKISKWITA